MQNHGHVLGSGCGSYSRNLLDSARRFTKLPLCSDRNSSFLCTLSF